MDHVDYITAEEIGLTPESLRELFPQATELVGLDGSPCWDVEDLK